MVSLKLPDFPNVRDFIDNISCFYVALNDSFMLDFNTAYIFVPIMYDKITFYIPPISCCFILSDIV